MGRCCLLILLLLLPACEGTDRSASVPAPKGHSGNNALQARQFDFGHSATPESLEKVYEEFYQAAAIEDEFARQTTTSKFCCDETDLKLMFPEKEEMYNLVIELCRLENLQSRMRFLRGEQLPIRKIEASELLENADSMEAEWYAILAKYVPDGTPMYQVRIDFLPRGAQVKAPIFFFRNRWVMIPNPGTTFELADKWEAEKGRIPEYEKDAKNFQALARKGIQRALRKKAENQAVTNEKKEDVPNRRSEK